MTQPNAQEPAASELKRALAKCRGAFVGVALLSGMLNVLFLTGSFFMLEVYDRVLPSRSVPTLVGLSIIALVLYLFQSVVDALRGRILTRIGGAVDEEVGGRAFLAITRLPVVSADIDSVQPSRDLDTIRGFLSGLGPTALFDLPWMPLYLGICFAFHPAIGWTAVAGGVILIGITLMTERLTRKPVEAGSHLVMKRNALSETYRRNAEVLRVMGMEPRMAREWNAVNREAKGHNLKAADFATSLGAFSKTFRMVLQSGVLAVGAYLVVNQQATAGIIIASSILTSRALAPVELVIAQWKSFITVRQSWRRLNGVLSMLEVETPPLELPKPERELLLDCVSVAPPGARNLIVNDVSFQLTAGQGVGVIGPSASGKSSLVRAIVGAWTPARGSVRLDGAALGQWQPERLGEHIGYLPQDVQLFAGTIAQNVARFHPQATSDSIIEACRVAGVHDMIVGMPDGYETRVGENGQALSAGQRQRVGLARALYGNPFLVVLDEPNSNLDGAGEEALTSAIMSVRLRGGVVVVVAHRPSALTALDLVLVLQEGRVQSFGPKHEVLGTPIGKPVVSRPIEVARPLPQVAPSSIAGAA